MDKIINSNNYKKRLEELKYILSILKRKNKNPVSLEFLSKKSYYKFKQIINDSKK